MLRPRVWLQQRRSKLERFCFLALRCDLSTNRNTALQVPVDPRAMLPELQRVGDGDRSLPGIHREGREPVGAVRDFEDHSPHRAEGSLGRGA